jgi:chromosome segregation ATPase
MAEKEKKDLLGEDRNKVTGEERLKVTISMPLWMKVRIWKESKEKGIPVWEYLAQLMQDSETLRKEGQGRYIEELERKVNELKRTIEELKAEKVMMQNEVDNWKSLYSKREKTIELLKNIIIEIKRECGACAIKVLESYKDRGTYETSAFIASLLLGIERWS